ncbi:MAG TPA: DUF5343 domain-containing protein [Solirubrobacteraceae bacterium]|jgi:hypothetical protein|nr:DUF5343 domain-containing protein [Solirubrobacteraceae bacterium]
MSLPSAYLTSTKNIDGILSAIQTAQAPSRFTISFLEQLGYKSSSDRLIINVLKALGFLNADGAPTERYYRFLDQTEAPKVLAEGLEEAYADLYQLNRHAHSISRTELKNKLKTLMQGQYSDAVLAKMATTFGELAKRADFSSATTPPRRSESSDEGEAASIEGGDEGGLDVGSTASPPAPSGVALGGLVYSIQIHLPESRDQAVYDALFRSLKTHLLQ